MRYGIEQRRREFGIRGQDGMARSGSVEHAAS
jgi:hypothetical protein